MFERIGRFSARYRWLVVIGWIAITVLITLVAPNLDDVASSDTSDFLPDGAPFLRAYEVFGDTFPESYSATSAVFVLEATEGDIRDDANWSFVVALTDWLLSDDAPDTIKDVLSPGTDMPLVADSMVAPDGALAIIMVTFSSGTIDDSTRVSLDEFRAYLDEHKPDGLDAYLSGSAPIITSYTDTAITSLDRTLIVTIVLVISLLLLVYRSPVSPIVPLLTVAMSYLISRGIVAWIGAYVMTITTYANVLLVVVLFGAGTDYCLFLISRFREEVADDANIGASTIRTVHRVGETITSSAGTVIVGFVAMSFAEMGLFSTTGPALAIGVVVVLLAGLTFTPAMLALLGQRTFWPGRATHRGGNWLYARISALVADRPVLTIAVIVLVLGPLAVYATGQQTTYDMLADLPLDNEARTGFESLDAHMGGGQVQPLDIVLSDLDPETALAEIDHWTAEILAVDGVAEARSLSAPLGQGNELAQGITRVDRQLELAAEALASLGDAGLDPVMMTAENMQLALGALPFVQEYLDTLEADYPQLADDEDLAGIRGALAGLPMAALSGSIDDSLATLQTHLAGLAETFSGIEGAYYFPEALPESLVEAFGGEDPLLALTGRYVRSDRTAAHIEVILAVSPYSDEATNVVRELRDLLPGGPAAISGYPTIMTDLRDTMDRDTFRSFSLVLLGIFIVLVFLLRALVSPVYLILTILLSYGATMGITRLASEPLFGTSALTWWVPFFMFVMLVALGMDYNIFLMGRVKEEVAKHGMREGVHRAVAATGAIITSAGLIMAGTFGAMMAGVVTGLRQLGFAVAVGVLLDTFVIRTALVPAIAVLLDRWNWWPGKTPQAVPDSEIADGDTDAASSVPVAGRR